MSFLSPMRNPFWRIKTLPWLTLLQDAALTILIATVLDILLVLGLSTLLRNGAGGLSPFLNLLTVVLPILAGAGMGALSVLLMERFFRGVYLDTAVLWALAPCLAVLLIIKGFIPQVPTFLVGLSYPTFIGIILGIFVRGKRYWRY